MASEAIALCDGFVIAGAQKHLFVSAPPADRNRARPQNSETVARVLSFNQTAMKFALRREFKRGTASLSNSTQRQHAEPERVQKLIN